MSKQLQIRNSTAEFLIFQAEDKAQGVQVFYQDENIWATQDAIATLFDKGRTTITDGELQEEVVCRKFRLTTQHGAIEGKTQTRDVTFYNLDAIISVGYRVNSIRATQFRRWATSVLRQFAIKGYVLDRKRMENGAFLSEDYFEHLLAEIHEIRLSERRFYQKLTDIYASSMDYDKDAPMTRQFFQMIQNKMHYAVHQHTDAELIMERADAEKEHMGLTTWENAPSGKIVKTDVSIAKNYLRQNELEDMGNIVSAVLDFAEARAKRHIPMTMEDWAKRIDAYLNSDKRPLLTDAGSVSRETAQEYAETEFEKYRVIQDRLFESDFDRFALPTLPFEEESKNAIEDGSK